MLARAMESASDADSNCSNHTITVVMSPVYSSYVPNTLFERGGDPAVCGTRPTHLNNGRTINCSFHEQGASLRVNHVATGASELEHRY